jgi:hypothetical protein
MSQKTTEGKMFTLDIPQREAKDGYLLTLFTSHLNLESVLKSPEFSHEPIRVYYLALSRISLITSQKQQEEIYRELENKIQELENDYKKKYNVTTLTDAQQNHILIVASIKTMGKVSIWGDKHMGISIENKVGFERRQRKKEKEAIKNEPVEPEHKDESGEAGK